MPVRPISIGKLPADLLERLLGRFGPSPPDLLLGPAVGEDACAIQVPTGPLVVASDPITFTTSEIGRLAVDVNANDLAATGARPKWFLATVLLPIGTTRSQIVALFEDLRHALSEIGAHLVGGHTEVTDAVRQPVVVGTMLGPVAGGSVLATAGVRPGHAVVQVGPVPVEGAAVLARLARAAGADLDPETLLAAEAALGRPGISVVKPALSAARLGATAMHDLTEGGLSGGLWELSVASGVALSVDREAVVWFPPGIEVCRALGADPWATLSSGSLLAAFAPTIADRAVDRLRGEGYAASVIAVAEEGAGVHDLGGQPLGRPVRDEVARLLAESGTPHMA